MTAGLASPATAAAGRLPALTLAALGVVFGDLGTSPLYALQEAFHPLHGVAASPGNVIGCTSLFIWSLIVMVSIKYVWVLMRADNQGEGGVLALLGLLRGGRLAGRSSRLPGTRVWLLLALVGTAMLYGDGVITPAISVLSAVEGLAVITPAFGSAVLPMTVAILVVLFAVQHKGSGRVGVAFGPILLAWFVAIFVLGAASAWQTPAVLRAFNPAAGLAFFADNGFRGFIALGAVVLCLTGGEALYADMGHFGRKPIQRAWYGLALPALVTNYLGQAALLLREPAAADRPFYSLVPGWALWPMVLLATAATVVASQALISAVFSLTHQAAQLGLTPRQRVVHTSPDAHGQIYLPALNWALMAATIAVVLGFRSSSSLAAAFGLAVSTTMAITTVLFGALARLHWRWPWWRVLLVSGGFLAVDLAFLGANTLKIADGGWLPLALGGVVFLLMFSWQHGRRQAARAHGDDGGLPLERFAGTLGLHAPQRVDGTAVFLVQDNANVPRVMLHHLKHNQVLHERVIVLSLEFAAVPRLAAGEQLRWQDLGHGILRVTGRYGYMDVPSVPTLLSQFAARVGGVEWEDMRTSYYLGREVATLRPGTPWWRALLLSVFIAQKRNEPDATMRFDIPPNRVVELGARLELPVASRAPA